MNTSNAALVQEPLVDHTKPISLTSKNFHQNKFETYAYLREHLPVHRASIFGLKIFVTARYDDCLTVVKDPRFLRNRSTVTGGSRMPFPVPGSIKALAESMITSDDPEHRRLRSIVQKAFVPKNLHGMSDVVEDMAHDLLDKLDHGQPINLQSEYALTIPTAVIAQLMGVKDQEMDELRSSIRVLSEGLSGWNVIRTLAWDLRKTVNFVRELIARKRSQPEDDILSALIAAEEEGSRLSEEELISFTFLLIVAGFETTVHLITNGTVALLQHPDQLQRLIKDPELYGTAVEEILRYAGPIHGTKMNYASEDLEISGVQIPKASMVMPLLGSANRDEEVFEDAESFNITRDPNKHLAFSQGNHFCLGAFLARMETKIALKVLFERCPDLHLAVPEGSLTIQRLPGWHRYDELPVALK
ncbi:MAG: cytochrome P450 [Pseudomonadota bacterium]